MRFNGLMKESTKKALLYGLLGFWGVIIAAGLSFLMAGHLIIFPSPDSKIEGAMKTLQNESGAAGQWFAAHVIADGCRCSGEALEHLLARGPRKDSQELIIYVGKELSEPLRASSYKTMLSDEAKLFRDYGVESAPLLALVSPEGKLVYAGGYSETRNGPIVEDTVIAEAMRGGSPKALPLFGCAVSKDMQDKVDPLGLKYK